MITNFWCFFFLNVWKEIECERGERERGMTTRKTSVSVWKKFKNYSVNLRLQSKNENSRKKIEAEKCPQVCPGLMWRYQSAKPCSRHCARLSHSWISPSINLSAPSGIKEKKLKTLRLCRYGDILNSNVMPYSSSPRQQFPFSFVLIWSRWISAMNVYKFSSPEFHWAAVEMFKLQALFVFIQVYINIYHHKCSRGDSFFKP